MSISTILEEIKQKEEQRLKMLQLQINMGCDKCSQWDEYYGCNKCDPEYVDQKYSQL